MTSPPPALRADPSKKGVKGINYNRIVFPSMAMLKEGLKESYSPLP